jgi:hypothetical protein
MFKKLFFLFFLASCALCLVTFCYSEDIKLPDSAGTFYPDDPAQLSGIIDDLLAAVEPMPVEGGILAFILPHAGYGFSGKTAAYGYKLIRGRPYKTVIIIGTSHFYGFAGVSVYSKGAFRTPLGDISIDEDFAQRLLSKKDDIFFDPKAFEKEHSVEVQLPFLQKALKDFKIVPVVMGDCSLDMCRKFAARLKQAMADRPDCLLIVSTDMYHGYDYQQALETDEQTLAVLKSMDYEALYYGLRDNKMQLCNGPGAVAALILAKDSAVKDFIVLAHTNSADIAGRKVNGIWTVGYASCVINKQGETSMLNDGQRKELLKLARISIETYLKTGKKILVSQSDPVLSEELGCFVTLHNNEHLRGCIGNIIGKQPLYLGVRDMAIESATADPRFPEVGLSELPEIDIEISVLSALKKVKNIDEIKIPKHGVLVKSGLNSGVFLPQVAFETGWSKEEFLSQLCSQKAGLKSDAWKDKDTELYIFEAEVFSEKSLKVKPDNA